MARTLKPLEVETYHGKLGSETVIFLDRNEKDFFAVVSTSTLRAVSVEALRSVIDKYVTNNNQVDWFPAIEIDKNSTNRLSGSVSLYIDRRYYGYNQAGELRISQWDIPDGKNRSDFSSSFWWKEQYGKFVLPIYPNVKRPDALVETDHYNRSSIYHGNTIFLPYREDLWLGLKQLIANIDMIRDRIDTLMETEDGLLQIANNGAGIHILNSGEVK